MRTLHVVGWLIDFILGSLIWAAVIVIAALAAPFALIAFFVYQIVWNGDRLFHVWLPFTPTALYMLACDPVGRILLGIPLAIISWWIVSWWFRRMIRRKLRDSGYEG